MEEVIDGHECPLLDATPEVLERGIDGVEQVAVDVNKGERPARLKVREYISEPSLYGHDPVPDPELSRAHQEGIERRAPGAREQSDERI